MTSPRPAQRRPGRFRPGSLMTGFGLATGLGVILGLIGPFGSYLNDGVLVRIAYWTANLWAGWLLFGIALTGLMHLAERRRWPLWLWLPAATAVLAIPPTVTSRLLAVRLWPVTQQVGWPEWYGQCLVISALAAAISLWASSRIKRRVDTAEATDPRDRLPPTLGREVLCLQMEDHYVRVHTARGSTLVLMSMAQAISGLKDVEGLQTHRSWWVARHAVEGVIEDGRNLRLRLVGGQEAPVSRSRVGTLREAGWLNLG